jgi:hypothetical protein
MPETAKNTEELVSAGFASLIALLGRYADDIKLQCAEATIDGELETSESLLETSRNILRFSDEVKTLSGRWSKGELRLPTVVPKKHQSPKTDRKIGHNKSAKTLMRVTVAGHAIDGGKAAEIFSAALERMGLEKVSQLGMRLSGIALVSRHPVTGYQSQIQKGGWYITTHASNIDKKRMLEKIGAILRIPVHIHIQA